MKTELLRLPLARVQGVGGAVQARVASETPPYHRLHRLDSPGLAYPNYQDCVFSTACDFKQKNILAPALARRGARDFGFAKIRVIQSAR